MFGKLSSEREMRELGLDFEWHHLSPGSEGANPQIPRLLNDETKPAGYTCYVEIDLGLTNRSDRCYKGVWKEDKTWSCAGYIKTPVEKMTAIYAPSKFNPALPADLIIYLHGYLKDRPGIDPQRLISPPINKYLKYIQLREAIETSGKNSILVVPTIGPLSQAGNLITRRGFDSFCDQVIAAINEYVIKKKGLKGDFSLSCFVIAAHSGGGKPLLSIAGLSGNYSKRINEFWGIDSWYQSNETWKTFGIKNPQKKIYGCYTSKSGLSSGNGKKLDTTSEKHDTGIPGNMVVRKGNPDDHFKVIVPYFNSRLINFSCSKTQMPENQPQSTKTDEDAAKIKRNEYKLASIKLSNDPIVVGKYRKETVKEAPSAFLPKIVRRALGDTGKDWFKNFTRITFLGRELKSGQFIHIEFARLLQDVENILSAKYGGSNKDPLKAGNFLLGKYEALSGSRKVSSTATFSMHMFGLAIDVNYLRNPFIQEGAIATLNEISNRAGWIINGTEPQKYSHKLKISEIIKIDKLVEKYFGLLDNPVMLSDRLKQQASGSPWKDYTLDKARKTIEKDLKKLAEKIARGDNIDIIKKGGFLDLPQEFIEGMIAGGLDWGGFYGDMMHFDMRNRGVGKKIHQERLRYAKEKNREAKEKFFKINPEK